MASEVLATSPAAKASGNESMYKPRYIDIGINLADPIYRGVYRGKQRHQDDLEAVISRAKQVGCEKLLVTGSDLTSSRHALEIAKEYPGVVYTTAGIHPCSSVMFSKSSPHAAELLSGDGSSTPCNPDPEQAMSESDHEVDEEKTASIISELRSLIESAGTGGGGLVAYGEFGLDYDRLHYCSKTIQLHSFSAQLDLVLSLKPQLPLFLHSRAAHADFVRLLKQKFGPRLERLEKGGVVHSFTGTREEMRELADLGLYIGTNGCSFKTEENCAVVREIPLDRLMLETDGPWCEVRPTHAGWRYLVDAKTKGEGIFFSSSNKTSSTRTPDDMVSISESSTTTTTPGTATPNPIIPEEVTTTPQTQARHAKQQKQKHQQQQQQNKKSKSHQKKEPELPERWPSVKAEKWVEGAMVKGRNEPCTIERVAQVVAGVRGDSLRDVCEAAWANTVKVFGLGDR
ncbi:hypothetical protein F5Y17DRAFT_459879 [Xylariaceae sp. FL0594]|nr:hypothetical protein F5Y17DRAFT_459879 [Xylariaceae sp. FL0594]